jgi:dolichol kinase
MLPMLSGILTLGIGDTAASLCGVKYGFQKWSKHSNKSIQGTVAAIISVIVSCAIIQQYARYALNIQYNINYTNIIYASTVTFLEEACTQQIDNLILPIIFLAML